MIEVKNVYKSFEGTPVLKNVSARFEPGKTNLIIGQSGSGKTVLLKSIVGLHEIDEGEIFYDNRSFTRMGGNQRKSLRQEIGMLFQGSALFDSKTVEENIRFPLDVFTNMPLSDRRDRANECLKRVDLGNVNNLFPSELSGGMQKRVAIARAVSLNPRYLFCDEPNSGLDPKTAIVIDNLIYEITKEYNMTTIVNTHDMNSVMGVGETVIFIVEGEKGWEGTKDDILNSDDPRLNDFIFASRFLKQLRDGAV
ncbi:MAG: ATP-binding cassette domain-containing protein [Marinilabilia sp.]